MNLIEVTQKDSGSTGPTGLERYSVLVADDDFVMANVFATVLQRAGHRIVGIASNGREAVTMAMKERPELIVMDIHMPVLDGLQAASEILEDRLVPIILSTGLVDLKAIERANDIRGLSYLVKPFSSAQLHVAVHLAVTQCGALSESDARK